MKTIKYKYSLLLILLIFISCNKNNVFVNDKVVYLSIKEGVFFIEGDVSDKLDINKFELERVLSKSEIENIDKIIHNTKYQKDNIDIIDCAVEGCYVFYEKGVPYKIIYNLSNGQKIFVYEAGKQKKTIYIKNEIIKLP
jgi:hypothetical protein